MQGYADDSGDYVIAKPSISAPNMDMPAPKVSAPNMDMPSPIPKPLASKIARLFKHPIEQAITAPIRLN